MKLQRWSLLQSVLWAIVWGLALTPALGGAATFTVNSTTDAVDANPGDGTCADGSGDCTLRAAIQETNALAGADTINVPAGTYLIAITGTGEDAGAKGDLDILQDLVLVGAGAKLTVVDGGGLDRVFEMRNNAVVAMSGLTIQNGNAGSNDGGGVLSKGRLVLTNAVVKNNAGKNGGGLQANGAGNGLTLTGVTLTGNSADTGGGAYCKGGGSPSYLTNCTVSGNTAASDGGGLFLDYASLINVTVANNTAPAGRGAGLTDTGGGAAVALLNTIIANNVTGNGCLGSPVSSGYNIDGDGTCNCVAAGDQVGVNPLLGPLQDNGGPTPTRLPATGSPAIDLGTATGAPGADQRGVARPQDGDGNGSFLYDVGAVEVLGTFQIQGRVFEDANFNGTAAAWDGGVSDVALANVDVELYGTGDAYVASATTNASGQFTFNGVPNGTYKVRVRSGTIGDSDTPPAGGFNAACAITDPASGPACALPDMTWANGAARYGGADPSTDDSATGDNAGPGNTWAPVTVSGANVTGLEFGFAYNLIANANDAGQGSLRQFIANANAIGTAGGTTANASQFRVPAGLLNGNGVALVALASPLPPVTDAGTTIDGSAQTTNTGDTNASGPEVRVSGSALAAAQAALTLSGTGGLVRGLIVSDANAAGASGILISGVGATGNFVRGCYVGTDQTGVAAAPNAYGIRLAAGAHGNTIGGTGAGEANVIAYNSAAGVSLTGATTDANRIVGNAIFENGGLGIDLDPAGVGAGGGSNDDQAAPALTAVVGGPGSDVSAWATVAAGDTVAFYRVGNAAAPVVTADPSGAGEGYLYLGRCTDGGACAGPYMVSAADADATAGGVRAVLSAGGASLGEAVTATATGAAGTSEFATNAAVGALAVVKRAYLMDGTPLASGQALPKGTRIRYLLYISNPGGAVTDVSLRDVLDPAFQYQAGTLRYAATVDACAGPTCTSAEEAAIYAAALAGTAGTDAVDGDPASVSGATLDVGNDAAANAQLDVAAGKLWAVVFTVRMN